MTCLHFTHKEVGIEMMTLNDPPLKSCGKLLMCEEQEEALSCFLVIAWRKSSKNLMVMMMMMMSPVFIKEIYEVW